VVERPFVDTPDRFARQPRVAIDKIFHQQRDVFGNLIRKVKETEGFARKSEDVREADFRSANRFTRQVARAADNVGCEPPQPPCIREMKAWPYFTESMCCAKAPGCRVVDK
jgi:hypothetical protein